MSVQVNIQKDGNIQHIQLEKGISLLKALHDKDIHIKDNCEGNLGCGQCHVEIIPQNNLKEKYFNQNPITDQEQELLDGLINYNDNTRLACNIIVDDSLTNSLIKCPKY